nr:ComF family protein [uncultured Sellimonas sp.]
MKTILDFVYPHVCPFCGKVKRERICDACMKKIQYIQEPRCKRCGKPLDSEQKEYCNDCFERIRGKYCFYDEGRSLWVHRAPVSDSVYQFKFHNRRIYGTFYAGEWVSQYGNEIKRWKADALIPIPMMNKKKRERGYNQAEILAKELSKQTGIPVIKNGLIRTKEVKAQKRLSKEARKRNLEGVFQIKSTCRLPSSVILLDDIYTTGNTINEAAKTLKKAGVKRVCFLTISIGQDI